MTHDEAQALMQQIGCRDTRNAAALHLAYVVYVDRATRGMCGKLPVSEAYHILSEAIKKPPAVKQGALFEAKGADL